MFVSNHLDRIDAIPIIAFLSQLDVVMFLFGFVLLLSHHYGTSLCG